MATILKSDLKPGMYITYILNTIRIYGYIISITDDEILYVRDTMTRWALCEHIREIRIIDKETFFNRVRFQAQRIGANSPSNSNILHTLSIIKNNHYVSTDDIKKALEKPLTTYLIQKKSYTIAGTINLIPLGYIAAHTKTDVRTKLKESYKNYKDLKISLIKNIID